MSGPERNGRAAGWAVSGPRRTDGDGTPLTKERGRVRDDSHALAPALEGRVPGPLAPNGRHSCTDLKGLS